ncbi:hypothetical protein PoB_000918000 [Plakobranchus ocellatus]|uniref:Uncharacterized protein n=1 Tax=Plakobranchus ocellatus TaxID=259542 RepID=A0AAV3YJJ2_9GAST|nr:hypothetical protein PoB_000918000 [Plakobranchus ocellatus]
MGCGKSRLRSPEDSDIDLKKNSSSNSSSNTKANKKSSRSGSGKSNSGFGSGIKVGGGAVQPSRDATSGSNKTPPTAQSQNVKKKKLFSGNVTSGASLERKTSDKEKDAVGQGKIVMISFRSVWR